MTIESNQAINELELKIRTMTEKVGGWGDQERIDGFINTIIEICEYYAEQLSLTPLAVFDALEKKRDYTYPNYYQWANFPKFDDVIVFKTKREMTKKLKPKLGFICPSCGGISKSESRCDADKKKCNWAAYGLFGTLGKGIRIVVTNGWLKNPVVHECFMPVALANESKDAE